MTLPVLTCHTLVQDFEFGGILPAHRQVLICGDLEGTGRSAVTVSDTRRGQKLHPLAGVSWHITALWLVVSIDLIVYVNQPIRTRAVQVYLPSCTLGYLPAVGHFTRRQNCIKLERNLKSSYHDLSWFCFITISIHTSDDTFHGLCGVLLIWSNFDNILLSVVCLNVNINSYTILAVMFNN